MKTFVRIIQVFVAILFIISGVVKANDPMGLSFKMQEFFELWNAGFTPGSFVSNSLRVLHKSSLALSIAMNTTEIMAGIALLVGWKKKFILWLLLLLIIFFTFLTGYAYLSGKFTNCGCFGDCLPITPLTSFTKDIALLAMIIFLLCGQRYITPVFTSQLRTVLLSLGLFLSLTLQWYVLNYLPVADCLPFKKGNNIAEQMKPPPGSKPDSIAIKYVYEKEGKKYEWGMDELPADFNTYKYVDRIDKVVRKGNADAPIKGFSLVGISGQDSSKAILEQPFAILAYAQDFKDAEWLAEFKTLTETARAKGVTVYVASPNLIEGHKAFTAAGVSGVQFFSSDFTVVRTVARTTPTILLLKQGTITNKWSAKEIAKAANHISETKL
jgi:uncharacterized membrane protein YphA (DoxX/SURF4 family)